MKFNLESVKKVLADLQAGIARRESVMGNSQCSPVVNNAQNAPYSVLEEERGRCLIYATNNYLPLFNREEHQLSTSVPKLLREPAVLTYKEWENKPGDIQAFPQYLFSPPKKDEILIDYLHRLRDEVEFQPKKTTRWWKSLRSFSSFLRKEKLWCDERGYLDILFPEDMAIHRFDESPHSFKSLSKNVVQRSAIVRKTPPTKYPIDFLAAADIIQTLITETMEGRSNLQRSSAEVLGLGWTCLAVSYSRIMTSEEILYDICEENLEYHEQPVSDCYKPSCYLSIQTHFGDEKIPISKTHYDYLKALLKCEGSDSRKSHVFKTPFRSLRRTFDRAVSKSPKAKDLGKITFLTLMSTPHLAIGRRFKLKKPPKSKD